LTLRHKIAHLIVIRTHGNTGNPRGSEWRNVQRWVRDTGAGGIIVVNRVWRGAAIKADPKETMQFTNRLQRLATLPLLVGGDFERSVSMRFDKTIAFPHAMAYAATGNPSYTRRLGEITAREARLLGFQWVFAPTADVSNNPDNPIIGIRAFGTDPRTVSEHVRAFTAGARQSAQRVLLTAKHFPGHGDTAEDSHLGMPVIDSDRKRLDSLELLPFRAAIDAGVDSVMSAHIALPRVDPSGVPSTISPVVIGGILRKEMGFSGLVTTDAMDMEGLAREYGSGEAAVRALEAGVDVLLMPRDPEQAVAAVVKAIAGKRLSVARIEESVRKVLRAKVRLGLHRARLANPAAVAELLSDTKAAAHAQEVADHAIAFLRGDRARVPLPKRPSTCVIALPDRAGNGQGDALLSEIRARAPMWTTLLLDPRAPSHAGVTEGCETVGIAAFLGFGGTGKLNPLHAQFIEETLATGKTVVLAAAGNPYLLRPFPAASAWLTTYSTVPVSEIALAKVWLGELTPQGAVLLKEESRAQ
jgi:beta-N-acetylhexosaminidase